MYKYEIGDKIKVKTYAGGPTIDGPFEIVGRSNWTGQPLYVLEGCNVVYHEDNLTETQEQ